MAQKGKGKRKTKGEGECAFNTMFKWMAVRGVNLGANSTNLIITTNVNKSSEVAIVPTEICT